MRNQQEAEKAEQQRIKKLVLNYDLGIEEDEYGNAANGESHPSLYTIQPNLNHTLPMPRSATVLRSTRNWIRRSAAVASGGSRGTMPKTQTKRTSETSTETKSLYTGSIVQPSHERGGSREYANAAAGGTSSGDTSHTASARPTSTPQSRGGSRRMPPATRKLQLSDVDW